MANPLELCDALINSGIEKDFEAVQFHEIAGYPLIALRRYNPHAKKHLYVSAGIHGDEPAPVFTIRELLLNDSFPTNANITICPLLNPTGLAAITRENSEGIDLNRDFKNPNSNEIAALTEFIDSLPPIDISICLHEDWESTGFYLYYLNPESKQVAENTVVAISSFAPIELAEEIDGRTANSGVIHPPDPFDPEILEGWPEAFYLYSKYAHQHFTVETPSSLPFDERILMSSTAVKKILSEIL